MNKVLQKSDVLLATVVKLFKSLRSYVDDIREQFTKYELETKSRLPDSDYCNAKKCVRKRSTRTSFFDDHAVETAMDLRTKFKVSTFLPIVDLLRPNLNVGERPIQRFINDSVSWSTVTGRILAANQSVLGAMPLH